MARALARARGLEVGPQDGDLVSSEASEDGLEPAPSASEVAAAARRIEAWGKRSGARRKLLRRIGPLDEARIGSSACAVRASVRLSGGGAAVPPLVFVPKVLPGRVARAALVVLRALPEESWQLATAISDGGEARHGAGSSRHNFAGCARGDAAALEPIFSALASVLPAQACLLQCSRYTMGDFIEPHDDSAFSVVGGAEQCRDVALVLHLTPNWTKQDGGLFVDHAGRSARAPVFNSLLAFRVPRQHEVTRVATRLPRYSIYGWFMASTRLYELGHARSPRARRKRKANSTAEAPARVFEGQLKKGRLTSGR